MWARTGVAHESSLLFGAEIRKIMTLLLLVRSLVQLEELRKECLPRTRLSGVTVARIRFLGQHVPSVALPQQPPAESVGANNAVPWAPGVRVDHSVQ